MKLSQSGRERVRNVVWLVERELGGERRFILGGLCSSPGVSHVYALSHNRVSLMLSVLYYFACMVYGLGRGN